ncbi:MAG: HlyC/CorC family transporter [Candidatus Desulforudis sp.]|nr:HlyC/CorC family transporter [Desulforudis sp.]
MNQTAVQIGLLIVLIALNAVFAAAEIALVTARRERLEVLAKRGNKAARAVRRLIKDPSRYFAVIQIGVTLAGFLASASAAVVLALPLQAFLAAVPVPVIAGNATGIAVFAVTLFIAILSLIYGELVPKRIALQKAEPVALLVGRPLAVFSRIVSPLLLLLTAVTNQTLRILGFSVKPAEERFSEEEIKQLVLNRSTLDKTEKRLITEVFDFTEAVVYDVMVPRTEIAGVPADTPVGAVLDRMVSTGHSRMPVYSDNLDTVLGVANIKDLVPRLLEGRKDCPVDKLIRPAYFVPDSVPISQLLRDMQERKISMAVAVDEFGGTSGLVTVETLVEQIVGEIWDEYDTARPDITPLDGGRALVRGAADLEEVNRRLGTAIPVTEHYTTLAGFILNHLGKVPRAGDRITLDHTVIEVAGMRGNRILQVLVGKTS